MVELTDQLSDEDLQRLRIPRSLRRQKEKSTQQGISENKARKLAAIRGDTRPITLRELLAARNRALRLMVRRLGEMKPVEVMQALAMLDGEITAQKIQKCPATTLAEPILKWAIQNYTFRKELT